MTALCPRTPATPLRRAQPASPVRLSGLRVRLSRPTSAAVVVHIGGELDTNSAPRLYALLAPRLSSTAQTLVLDLSELEFLGVAGLELLAHARRRAASRDMAVCLVDGPVCVNRALRAAGWAETIPTYSTLAAAMADLPGRAREDVPHAAG